MTFARAKALASQFNISENLHPLFVDDPAMYFYSNQMVTPNYFVPNHPIYLQSQDSFLHRNSSPSNSTATTTTTVTHDVHENFIQQQSSSSSASSLVHFPSTLYQETIPSYSSHLTTATNVYQDPLPSSTMLPPQMPTMYGYTSSNHSPTSGMDGMDHYR